MSNKQEGIFAIIAAIFVMFSAMLNPIVSVITSVILLVAFSAYKLLIK